jgi:catechol 2,3-dioxygenase-like lactoylglutathione lyase family enzyme
LCLGEALEEATRRFYRDSLGLVVDSARFRIGHTTLGFARVNGEEPFYHFALRVPRNRFTAAREWFGARTPLLADEETGETTFRFDNWNADACYGLDPAGNIVELIAHGDLPEEGPGGPFAGAELLGVCELGVVGPDTRAMANVLDPLGIHLSDGTLDEPGRLAFMGGRDGVLILCPEGRGWMPTDRPAEPHPVVATVAGNRAAEVVLPGTQHRIRTVPTG